VASCSEHSNESTCSVNRWNGNPPHCAHCAMISASWFSHCINSDVVIRINLKSSIYLSKRYKCKSTISVAFCKAGRIFNFLN
jgi:hypothetical protein